MPHLNLQSHLPLDNRTPITGVPPSRTPLTLGIQPPATTEITPQTAPTAAPIGTQQFSGKFSNEAIQNFNLALTGLLTRAQGLSSQNLRIAENRLEEESLRRISQPGDIGGLGLSPAQQSQIRGARVGATESERAVLAAQRSEREAAISRLPGTLSALSQFANQFQDDSDEFQATQFVTDASGNVKFIGITKGGKKVIKDFGDIAAGKTQAAPKTLETANGIFQWDSAQSKWIDTGLEPGGEFRPLPASQTVLLADGAFLPGVLSELETTINANSKLIGPISGKIPFSQSREVIKDDLQRAAQLVGKFMEGGVLRKEDEVKYKKMLPQLEDLNATVALDKLQGVRDMLQAKNAGYIKAFGIAGFDVSGFEDLSFGAIATPLDTPNNEIPVVDIASGQSGWIDASEFDPSIYQRL